MVPWVLTGTNEPVFDWQYAGSNYRLSVVGGLVRMEEQLRDGGWYLIEPSHETAALMVCAEALVSRLVRAEQSIHRLERFRTGPKFERRTPNVRSGGDGEGENR